MMAKQKQSNPEPQLRELHRKGCWAWVPLLGPSCLFCPGDQQHLPHCPSAVPQDTWEGGLSSGQKAEPVKGYTGQSPSDLGPNHLIAKGRWSQGQREEWCFLTSSRLASCRLSRTVALCFGSASGLESLRSCSELTGGTHHLSVHDISVDKNIK